VRGWVIGMAVGVLLIVGLSALIGASSVCSVAAVSPQNPNPRPHGCPAPPTGPDGEWVTDSFYFVHRPLRGNGSITVRVTSLTGLYSAHAGLPSPGKPLAGMTHGVQPWSKAGIIIKASTAEGSAYAAMMVTGSHGVRMQSNFTNDMAGLAGRVSAASPRWLRLTRAGDLISGYDSADGVHWTLVGTARLAELPATAQPGHTVMSTSLGGSSAVGGPALATATFDQMSRHGTWPESRWTGEAIQRSPDEALPPSVQGFRQSAGRFTVSGSGDIAPVAGDSANRLEQILGGTFAGLIAVLVIGVMFITVEYRRRLIHATFTASPRRIRVLTAKAIVLAAITFFAGLIAATVTIPLGERLLRDNGNPIPAVPALTLLRIAVGTAALLAVAAVLALAVGVLLRRGAAAVTAVIAGIVLPYLLAVVPGVLPAGAEQWLVRVTPAAAFAVQGTVQQYPQVTADYTPRNGYFPLAPWAGFAVLCAWTAGALVLALFLLRRRDV
jgi:ABC-type transport system involved in multi-copper enzyme maturation permease subunit